MNADMTSEQNRFLNLTIFSMYEQYNALRNRFLQFFWYSLSQKQFIKIKRDRFILFLALGRINYIGLSPAYHFWNRDFFPLFV